MLHGKNAVRLGIDQKTFADHRDKDMGFKFAFCIEHAGFHRSRFAGVAQIICDLAVEKSEPVSPRDPKLRARGEVEEARSPRLWSLRHYSPDEKRLSSCLRNPRRNG